MPEVIVFPDVEDLLVGYLSAQLAARGESATVHVQIPNPRPDEFVTVPRVGGPRRNLVVDAPTIGFEAWAQTTKRAHDLCQLVRALVHALRGQTLSGVPFYRISEFAGPANLPDSRSTQPRYVFTASLTVRGTAI